MKLNIEHMNIHMNIQLEWFKHIQMNIQIDLPTILAATDWQQSGKLLAD